MDTAQKQPTLCPHCDQPVAWITACGYVTHKGEPDASDVYSDDYSSYMRAVRAAEAYKPPVQHYQAEVRNGPLEGTTQHSVGKLLPKEQLVIIDGVEYVYHLRHVPHAVYVLAE